MCLSTPHDLQDNTFQMLEDFRHSFFYVINVWYKRQFLVRHHIQEPMCASNSKHVATKQLWGLSKHTSSSSPVSCCGYVPNAEGKSWSRKPIARPRTHFIKWFRVLATDRSTWRGLSEPDKIIWLHDQMEQTVTFYVLQCEQKPWNSCKTTVCHFIAAIWKLHFRRYLCDDETSWNVC